MLALQRYRGALDTVGRGILDLGRRDSSALQSDGLREADDCRGRHHNTNALIRGEKSLVKRWQNS